MQDAEEFDWRRWDYILAALIMGGMALITFANILSREIFGRSVDHVEEITSHLFVYAVVIGTGIAFERGSHLGMVTFYKILPDKAKKVIVWINTVLSTLLFMVICIILSRTVYDEITIFKARSESLEIYQWIYYVIFLALCPSVFIGIFRGSKKTLTELREQKENHD